MSALNKRFGWSHPSQHLAKSVNDKDSKDEVNTLEIKKFKRSSYHAGISYYIESFKSKKSTELASRLYQTLNQNNMIPKFDAGHECNEANTFAEKGNAETQESFQTKDETYNLQ